MNMDAYKNTKVLITGHTGFKGAWLSAWLHSIGAQITGFSLPAHDNDHVYQQTRIGERIYADEKGDINDLEQLKSVFAKHQPTIVFHLAAQAIVLDSYEKPVDTFMTNVIGTTNVLECMRQTPSVKAGIIITTDKCYRNKEEKKPFTENEPLGGHDPYSASKACAELVIDSYRKSFSQNLASARAGNVIGGGDYAKFRLLPDCIRSLSKNEDILVRNPHSVRPWQHVIEPLYGYLLLGERLLQGKTEFADAWNFGPDLASCITAHDLATHVISSWGSGKVTHGKDTKALHEAKTLTLDTTKAKAHLPWKPKWDVQTAVKKSVAWYKGTDDAYGRTLRQIREWERA
jgi:CDP-glucose 4,6-dehydratase